MSGTASSPLNLYDGCLRKLVGHAGDTVSYQLPHADGALLDLNPWVGHTLRLVHHGVIRCCHCNRTTSKSYQQGHCFVCMRTLAACDRCMVRPDTCHHHEGTCREPDWAAHHCMAPHVVYLSNTTGPKVGITRRANIPQRWIDQGAIQALPILDVTQRRVAGLIEVHLAQAMADKTQWRRLITSHADPMDLLAFKHKHVDPHLQDALQAHPVVSDDAVVDISQAAPPLTLTYPVLAYPDKACSLSLDRIPSIEGKLLGIKGQYLLFEHGGFNVRKHTGYHVSIHALTA